MIQIVIIIFLFIIAVLGAILCYYQNKKFLLFDLTTNRRLGHIMYFSGTTLLVVAVGGALIYWLLPLVWTLLTLVVASLITGFVGLSFANSL
ncbi:hypothetical protein [Latilactobacillus graminis]|uniref:Uncharacterized protein n=1 Tax=Latilactobacillus graminis TaxID=60519 RepID=A0ABX6C7E3_9LACO|nr:hypothetical protein [Latilactobacillus graminis]QFP79526.1 hypothetical protein LG542_04450 [Latilactobacillus graminis]